MKTSFFEFHFIRIRIIGKAAFLKNRPIGQKSTIEHIRILGQLSWLLLTVCSPIWMVRYFIIISRFAFFKFDMKSLLECPCLTYRTVGYFELSFICFEHFVKFSEFFALLKSVHMPDISFQFLPLFQIGCARFISLSITKVIFKQIVIM